MFKCVNKYKKRNFKSFLFFYNSFDSNSHNNQGYTDRVMGNH